MQHRRLSFSARPRLWPCLTPPPGLLIIRARLLLVYRARIQIMHFISPSTPPRTRALRRARAEWCHVLVLEHALAAKLDGALGTHFLKVPEPRPRLVPSTSRSLVAAPLSSTSKSLSREEDPCLKTFNCSRRTHRTRVRVPAGSHLDGLPRVLRELDPGCRAAHLPTHPGGS